MRRQFIKQVGLSTLGVLLLPKIVFSNDKIIKGMRKKPMLAYPASAKAIDYSKPTFIQPKLDGVRCVIQAEPWVTNEESGYDVVAYSRTGKEWKNIEHILAQLKPFFKRFPHIILDGELYNHGLRDDFEKIISLVRKTKPTAEDRLEASKLTQFHCYDIIDEELPFKHRINFVHESLMLLGDSIHTVDTCRLFNEDEAKEFHARNLDNGYEGSIVRTNDTYQCKRSHNLRKFKDFHDAEATLTGWVEGKGKRIGTIGKFTAIDSEGNEFGMPVMDKFKYLQDNFEEMKTWVGRTATFTYFERTKANSYRHPLFKAIRDYE
jgi:DNA ligase-1